MRRRDRTRIRWRCEDVHQADRDREIDHFLFREVGGDVRVDFLRRMRLGDESERLRPFESSALPCGKRLSSLAPYRKKAIFEN